jgi:hypothetical protein
MYSNILKKYLDVIRIFEAYFRAHDIITGGIQTKSSLNAIQTSFNDWQKQCDLSLGQLSRLITYATGDNHVHLEGFIDAK